ncbi:MAG: hypothetical protein ACD_37C00087G0001 [uncultured bacterium]|nr:MAG: hypothetical protein ACD_37C00087G0001 [uncultured bacterium]
MGGEAFIILNANGDDPAGAVAMGIYVSLAFAGIAIAAAFFEWRLQDAVDHKKATK